MKQTFTGRGGWEKDGLTENWGMYLIQKPVSGGPITKTSVATPVAHSYCMLIMVEFYSSKIPLQRVCFDQEQIIITIIVGCKPQICQRL